MTTDFRLPDLGEGLPEAEIVQWRVAVGDTVTLNQPIAEVETAKAVVELPSPYAGVVETLHAEAGQIIEVGSVLISFDLPGEPADAAPSSDDDAEEEVPPNLVGYGAAPTQKNRPARRARGGASSSTPPSEPGPQSATRAERPRATPPVRKLARDLGVDLHDVTPSHADGVIRREDVRGFAASSPPAGAEHAPAQSGGAPIPGVSQAPTRGVTRTPIRSVRRTTAAAMVRSAFTAPHVTCFHTVDVTRTVRFVQELRDDRAWEQHRIGVLAVVARATCLALARTPELNSRWDEEAGEIVHTDAVNLGIAAATPRGLVVPNIRDADLLSLPALSASIRELATTAREGQTTPAAMRGGTFSISNIGTFGIEAGTPIINPGEAGILAVGAAQKRPWEHRGRIKLRDVMTLSLSFDHRLVDGAQGAQFLVDVADVLRDPARSLLLS